jgi:hypothetical protein
MSHDALIAKLANDAAPVTPFRVPAYAVRLFAIWAITALAIVAVIGARQDMGHMASIAKPLYFLSYGFLLAISVLLSAIPGRAHQLWVYASLGLLMLGLAAFFLVLYQRVGVAITEALAMSDRFACVLTIGVLGVVPLYWMMRWLAHAAPDTPFAAGMAAGAASGAIAAAAYALHCEQDSLAYLAMWYLTPILGYSLLGGLIGGRLLRW